MNQVGGGPVPASPPPTGRHPPIRRGSAEEVALQRDSLHCIAVAQEHLLEAKRRRDEEQVRLADGRLHAAVEASRNLGFSWGDISDVLGMARGNAYRKYRPRPADDDFGDHEDAN